MRIRSGIWGLGHPSWPFVHPNHALVFHKLSQLSFCRFFCVLFFQRFPHLRVSSWPDSQVIASWLGKGYAVEVSNKIPVFH